MMKVCQPLWPPESKISKWYSKTALDSIETTSIFSIHLILIQTRSLDFYVKQWLVFLEVVGKHDEID